MIHHIFANKSNIGDWLSARGIQSLLQGEEIAEYFCDAPFVPDTLARLAEARATDLIVIGGGGLFMDYFTPFWEGICRIADRVPVCIWGVGYCDLKQESSLPPHGLIEEVVRKTRLCVVRDELTRQRLARYDLPPPVACPSLCVIEPPPRERQGILHVDNYTTVGAAAYKGMDTFGRQMAARLGRSYWTTNNRIAAGDESALERVLNLYADSDIVLSSALHGCIIGVAMGCRVIAVSGDRKIDSFMQAAGLERWICDASDLVSLTRIWTTISTQVRPFDFVEQARHRHRDIAARICANAQRTRD